MYSHQGNITIIMGENGTLMENKVQWAILKGLLGGAILKGLLGGDLGVANIYAPNIPRKWCFLWVEMIQKFIRGCRWILANDWNIME
jgi:hypothetical protein